MAAPQRPPSRSCPTADRSIPVEAAGHVATPVSPVEPPEGSVGAKVSDAVAGLIRRPLLHVSPSLLHALQSPAEAVDFIRADSRLLAGLRYAQSGLLDQLVMTPEARAAGLAAAKYILRAAGRPTPYGLFAGVCPAQWSDGHWSLPDLDAVARDPRVDRPRPNSSDPQLSFQLNPTATAIGDWLIYYAPGAATGLACPSTLRSVALDTLTRQIVAHRTIDSAALDELSQVAAVSQEACLAAIRTLREYGVLLPHYPPLVCKEFSDLERCSLAQAAMDPAPSPKIGSQASPRAPETKPIEVAHSRTPADIPRSLRSELALAASVLDRVMLRADPLTSFRQRFLQRFDTNLIPLPLVCSREYGLGNDGGLLPGSGLTSPTIEPHPIVGSLVGEDDVDLAGYLPKLPPEGAGGFDHVVCRLVSTNSHLSTTMLGAGTEMVASLARAGVVLPQVAEFVHKRSAIVEQQAHPAVMAEIVFLTNANDGNAARRCSTYTHEIPILGHGSAPLDKQLPPSSLLLGVRDGRFTLRCRATGREVSPRLSTAQNPHHPSVPFLIRLLALLQHETGARGIRWSWGQWRFTPSLPRVRVGPVTVSPRSWRPLVSPMAQRYQLDDNDLLRWIEHHRIPRFVLLEDPLQESMVLDLRSRMCRSLVLAAKRSEQSAADPIRLCEIDGLHDHERMTFEISEAILEVARPPVRVARSIEPAVSRALGGTKRHFPGGAWAYVRIYCGPMTADDLIREILPQVRQRCVDPGSDGRPASLFFVRYSESGTHLRIRINAGMKARNVALGTLLSVPRLPSFDGRIDRVELATYVPEHEIYGTGRQLDSWHHWSTIDSEFCENVLGRLMSSDWHARLPWAMLWTAEYARVLGVANFGLHPRRSNIPSGTRNRIDEELRRARDLFAEVFTRDSPAYRDMRAICRRANQAATELRERHSDRLPTLVERGVHLHFNRIMPEVPQGAELGFIWGVRRLLGWVVHTQAEHIS